MPRVKRLPENILGRDFIIGDIHGAYGLLLEALRAVKFNTDRDRLYGVGDLVDRGPESRRAYQFLRQPWFHPVRGNHEEMFLEIYAETDMPDPAIVDFVTARNGMLWWRDLPQNERLAFILAFRTLPIAIEVQTNRGSVGIIHAEVPQGMSWPLFLCHVDAGQPEVIETALWGRDRAGNDDGGVPGIDRIFVGHTPRSLPIRQGNVFYIDTGAVFGLLNPTEPAGQLTFAELACRTVVLTAKHQGGLVDLRVEEEPESAPFGQYASPSP